MQSTSGKPGAAATARRRSTQGRTMHRACASLSLALIAAPLGALAGNHTVAPSDRAKAELEDLSLSNFVSSGWTEPWKRFPRGEGTPDMAFLRVQSNFLVQLFRLDVAFQENRRTDRIGENTLLTGTLEYALNRRLMLALVGNYRWLDSRLGRDEDGGALAAFARVQLVENRRSSLAFTFRAGFPNRDLGEKDTTLGFALAGWHDLAPLGLGRTGLYYHVQEETLLGPAAANARRNSLTYALTLAHTWTKPDAFLGNATTFLECWARTDLDGADPGHTLVTLTPGVRATFFHRHILMAGVEFPVTSSRPFDHTVRLTYICNF